MESLQQNQPLHSFEVEGRPYTIEIATEEDVSGVARFEQTHFKVGEPYTEAECQRIYQIGNIFMVRNQEGVVIGVASITYGPESHPKLELKPSDAYYAGAVLSPESRGKGISSLSHVLEGVAIERGMTAMYTCVRESNIPSQRALTNAGFRIIERRENFMPPNPESQDDGSRLIMVKELLPAESQAATTVGLPDGISPADRSAVTATIEAGNK